MMYLIFVGVVFSRTSWLQPLLTKAYLCLLGKLGILLNRQESQTP